MKKASLFILSSIFISFHTIAQIGFFDEIIFEDEKFHRALVYKTNIAFNLDQKITPFDCENITSMDLDMLGSFGNEISSMPEIQYFTNLTSLTVSNNNLTALDLSKLTKLTYLDASGNEIESFDFSNTPNIKELDLYNNEFDTLDITPLTKLEYIELGAGGLYYNETTIDFSQNIALKETFIQQTRVSSLDVSNNINLENLFFVTSDLIEVNIGINNKLKSISLQYNELTSLDLTGAPNLTSVNVEQNPDLTTVCILPTHDTSNWIKSSNTIWDTTCEILGVEKNHEKDFKVIQTKNEIIIQEPINEWKLTTSNGTVIQNGASKTIDISTLNIGLYLLYLSDGSNYSSQKIIK